MLRRREHNNVRFGENSHHNAATTDTIRSIISSYGKHQSSNNHDPVNQSDIQISSKQSTYLDLACRAEDLKIKGGIIIEFHEYMNSVLDVVEEVNIKKKMRKKEDSEGGQHYNDDEHGQMIFLSCCFGGQYVDAIEFCASIDDVVF